VGTLAGHGWNRRRVLVTTIVAAVGLAGTGLIGSRGHRTARVAVVRPPASTVKPSTTNRPAPTKNSTATTNTVMSDSGFLQEFTPVSETTWWAVVADNLEPKSWVVRTVDRGLQWRNVSPRAGYVASSYFLNADDAWIEAGYLRYPKQAAAWRTRDGGRSWEQIGEVPNDCQLQFVDELHGWCTLIGAAMGSEAVDLWRTSDGGVTWTRASRSMFAGNGASTPGAIPTGCDKSVTFTSPTVGWSPFWCSAGGGGSPPLYQSTDGGARWHALPPVPFPTLPIGVTGDSGSGLGTPVVQGTDVAMTLNIWGRPGATAIASSSDGGTTWRTQLVPGATRQWAVDLIDPTHWRLADGTVLVATDDAGNHWRTTTPNVNMKDSYGALAELKFLSTDVGWAIPGPNGGALSWTTDGGATWKPIKITAGPYRL
jgi:photosystem II stability/assembly factor-like uncharacterized protein